MNNNLKNGLFMNNNEACVVTLKNISSIEGADKIKQADVYLKDIKLTQVVVGVETKEDTKVVYFDSNICINECLTQDFPDLAKYLGKHNRVKTIKLKGIISNGLCVDLDKFYKYFKNEKEAKSTLVEGYSFSKIREQDICKKYIVMVNEPSKSKKTKGKGKISSRMIPGIFAFHCDTNQLLRNIHKINPDDIISISAKFHGSSSIVSNCLVKKKLNFKERIAKKLGVKVVETEYDYIYASRRVIKNKEFPNSKSFYSEDIWAKSGRENFEGKLNKGETVYYEIVGFLENGKYIQKQYDYGCTSPNYKIVVYRITSTNIDGVVTEYSWSSMKERCKELNVPMVKEYYYGKAKDLYPNISIENHWQINFVEQLKKDFLEKKSADCINDVPDEGIVIRRESISIDVYKLKSELFILRESKLKDDEVEDIEDLN